MSGPAATWLWPLVAAMVVTTAALIGIGILFGA